MDITNETKKTNETSQNTEVKKEPSLSDLFELVKMQNEKITSLQSEITGLKSVKQEVKKEVKKENVENDKGAEVKQNQNLDVSELKKEMLSQMKKELFLETLTEEQKKVLSETPELSSLSIDSLKKVFKQNIPVQNVETDKKKVIGVGISENNVTTPDNDDVFAVKRKIDEQSGIKEDNIFKTKVIR